MGRGRRGLIEQSQRKPKRTDAFRQRETTIVFEFGQKREIEETKVPEHVFDFMKNMNQKQLVDFLLSNDNWHVKTSGINASGN